MASQKRHEIKRKDWEVVLDQLYKRCIAPTARGIGIISNTSRENSGDVEGELQEELTYRIKAREQGNLAYKMRQFNTEAFYNFFKLRSQSKKEDQDFFRLKKQVPFEVLVFPLTQGLVKKGLLIFESPVESMHLQKIIRIVLDEMKKPATSKTQEEKKTEAQDNTKK